MIRTYGRICVFPLPIFVLHRGFIKVLLLFFVSIRNNVFIVLLCVRMRKTLLRLSGLTEGVHKIRRYPCRSFVASLLVFEHFHQLISYLSHRSSESIFPSGPRDSSTNSFNVFHFHDFPFINYVTQCRVLPSLCFVQIQINFCRYVSTF